MATRIKRDVFTGELVEETYDPSPRGRTLIYREPVSPHLVQGRAGQTRATRPGKLRVSRALGVPCAQVGRFNAELESFGITESRYNDKTGFLESSNDDHHAAAFGVRGCYDEEAQTGVAMQLADKMGY